MKKGSVALKLLTVTCILALALMVAGCPPSGGGGGGGSSRHIPLNTEFQILRNGVPITNINEIFKSCEDDQRTLELRINVLEGSLKWEIEDTPAWLIVNPRSGVATPGLQSTVWITIDSTFLDCPDTDAAALLIHDLEKDVDLTQYLNTVTVTVSKTGSELNVPQSVVNLSAACLYPYNQAAAIAPGAITVQNQADPGNIMPWSYSLDPALQGIVWLDPASGLLDGDLSITAWVHADAAMLSCGDFISGNLYINDNLMGDDDAVDINIDVDPMPNLLGTLAGPITVATGCSQILPGTNDKMPSGVFTLTNLGGPGQYLDYSLSFTPDLGVPAGIIVYFSPNGGQIKSGSAPIGVAVDLLNWTFPETTITLGRVTVTDTLIGTTTGADLVLSKGLTPNLSVDKNELDDLSLDCLDLSDACGRWQNLIITNTGDTGSCLRGRIISEVPWLKFSHQDRSCDEIDDWDNPIYYPDPNEMCGSKPCECIVTQGETGAVLDGQTTRFVYKAQAFWYGGETAGGDPLCTGPGALECGQSYETSYHVGAQCAEEEENEVEVSISIQPESPPVIWSQIGDNLAQYCELDCPDCPTEITNLDPSDHRDLGCRPGDCENCYTWIDVKNNNPKSFKLWWLAEANYDWAQFCVGEYSASPDEIHPEFPDLGIMDPAIEGNGWVDGDGQLQGCSGLWTESIDGLYSNPIPEANCQDHYTQRIYVCFNVPGVTDPWLTPPVGDYTWGEFDPEGIWSNSDTFYGTTLGLPPGMGWGYTVGTYYGNSIWIWSDAAIDAMQATNVNELDMFYQLFCLNNTCLDGSTDWATFAPDQWIAQAYGTIDFLGDIDIYDINGAWGDSVQFWSWLSMVTDANNGTGWGGGDNIDPVIYILDSNCDMWDTWDARDDGATIYHDNDGDWDWWHGARNNTLLPSNIRNIFNPNDFWTTSWEWRDVSARLHPAPTGLNVQWDTLHDYTPVDWMKYFRNRQVAEAYYLAVADANGDWGGPHTTNDTNYTNVGNYCREMKSWMWVQGVWNGATIQPGNTTSGCMPTSIVKSPDPNDPGVYGCFVRTSCFMGRYDALRGGAKGLTASGSGPWPSGPAYSWGHNYNVWNDLGMTKNPNNSLDLCDQIWGDSTTSERRASFRWANPISPADWVYQPCSGPGCNLDPAAFDLFGCINDPANDPQYWPVLGVEGTTINYSSTVNVHYWQGDSTLHLPPNGNGEMWWSFYLPSDPPPITIDIDAIDHLGGGNPPEPCFGLEGSLLDLRIEIYDDDGNLVYSDSNGNLGAPLPNTSPDPYIWNLDVDDYKLPGTSRVMGKYYLRVLLEPGSAAEAAWGKDLYWYDSGWDAALDFRTNFYTNRFRLRFLWGGGYPH